MTVSLISPSRLLVYLTKLLADLHGEKIIIRLNILRMEENVDGTSRNFRKGCCDS